MMKIVQIMEHGEWKARFRGKYGSYTVSLVGWALIEDEDGQRQVVSLVLDDGAVLVDATSHADFESFMPPYLHLDKPLARMGKAPNS